MRRPGLGQPQLGIAAHIGVVGQNHERQQRHGHQAAHAKGQGCAGDQQGQHQVHALVHPRGPLHAGQPGHQPRAAPDRGVQLHGAAGLDAQHKGLAGAQWKHQLAHMDALGHGHRVTAFACLPQAMRLLVERDPVQIGGRDLQPQRIIAGQRTGGCEGGHGNPHPVSLAGIALVQRRAPGFEGIIGQGRDLFNGHAAARIGKHLHRQVLAQTQSLVRGRHGCRAQHEKCEQPERYRDPCNKSKFLCVSLNCEHSRVFVHGGGRSPQ